MGTFVRASRVTRVADPVLLDTLWAMDSIISAPGPSLLGSNVAFRDASNPFRIAYYLQRIPSVSSPGAHYSQRVFRSRHQGGPSGERIIYNGFGQIC